MNMKITLDDVEKREEPLLDRLSKESITLLQKIVEEGIGSVDGFHEKCVTNNISLEYDSVKAEALLEPDEVLVLIWIGRVMLEYALTIDD